MKKPALVIMAFEHFPGDTIVSMNFWGFTPKMLKELDARFAAFLDGALINTPLKGEYFLPSVVNDYPEQNLDRTRTQFKLVADMEQQWEAMAAVVAKYA